MRSQSSVLAHSTKSLNSLITNKKPHHSRSTTPAAYHSTLPACSKLTQSATQSIQMTTGGGVSGNNTNQVQAPQKSLSSSSFPSLCNTITSASSVSNTLSKASSISSTIRHSNGSLSTTSNNNNSSTTINNNKTASKNNNGSSNTNNNESNNNQNPNWSKLQTLEQRKLELEKLLNEKNWLLQQIYKQEAQVLNGNYENFNLFDNSIKDGGNFISTSGTTCPGGTTNSIQRRKGSSSLKLNKSNVHFNGKNNRITLSKSEYDLVQENKHNNQQTTANQNVISLKKRSGPPQKTNSFHDSTSASALSLTKSPSLEYNGNTSQSGGGVINSTNGSIKYNVVRPHHGSTENLTKSLGVTQCDKYYLSPTSQMYSDGSGFIKASQNIKQCLSPSTVHKVIDLNDTEAHRSAKQQQLPSANGQNLVHHNGSHPYLDQYESVDGLSLSPSTNYDQGQHAANQHSNLLRTLSNNDRSAWCDSTSYVELDSDGGNQYHNLKPLSKKTLATAALGSSVQQSPESSPSMGHFYSIGSMVVGSYPNMIEKACDEISISSVNSETSKKPKNKQWMESSLDGPIMRQNILHQSAQVADTISLCPSRSPTLSQNPQYSYYNVARHATSSSSTMASGKITPSPAASGSSLLVVPGVSVRPPARTLAHHSHPHHKQSYRERTKLSSQSMSSGSYRAPKAKIDDDNNHLSQSTSYLNVDPYHHHHFHHQTALQAQPYHHNHYHVDIPNSSTITLQQMQQQQQPQQKPSKPPTPSTSQQLPLSKFSPTISSSTTNGDEFVGTIRYATSVAAQPSRLCNPSQAITKTSLNNMHIPNPPNTLSIGLSQQLSPKSAAVAATSPDIRIESPKNMTVVQQATFLPYKEVTKPFEMSDFYKYSTKYRQKEANTTTMSKNTP